MLTRELQYDLPEDLIAIEPVEPRDSARLMVIHRGSGQIEHARVSDLPGGRFGLACGDLIVINQTRVLPARFRAERLETGGSVGGLYLGQEPGREEALWSVMLESRGTLQVGERLGLEPGSELELVERGGGGRWVARLHSDRQHGDVLTRVGSTPLPPYIRRRRRALGMTEVSVEDQDRYNTIYASQDGSVAAPTAGLHFTDQVFSGLAEMGVARSAVTLHVGLGTFAPVRADRLQDHQIHRERIEVPADTVRQINETRARGGRVIPIGTTSVRALESLPDPLPPGSEAYSAWTGLFITPGEPGRPGFEFRFTDGLLTNFHLPGSTLMALVAALPGVGIDRLKAWYRLAIEERYRFYSYGDAMLIL